MRITGLKKQRLISKDRHVDLEQLFTYELSSISHAIANDGSLTKTNKAQTLHNFEVNVQPLTMINLCRSLKSSTAVFVDHMACVQKLTPRASVSTLGDLYTELTKYVQVAFKESDTVQVVSDKYDTLNSIKAGERKRNEKIADSPEIAVHSTNKIIPRNMRASLANPKRRKTI